MTIKAGICPECGGQEIYTRQGRFNNMVVAWLSPKTDIFVCVDCGYIAEFLSGEMHINHVRNNWKRIAPLTKRKNDALTGNDDKQSLTES